MMIPPVHPAIPRCRNRFPTRSAEREMTAVAAVIMPAENNEGDAFAAQGADRLSVRLGTSLA